MAYSCLCVPVAYEIDFGDLRLKSRLALNIQITAYLQEKNICSQICLTNLSDIVFSLLSDGKE